ncbi:MAG: AraC family transcriptional regulator [Actinomycetes bacterium]
MVEPASDPPRGILRAHEACETVRLSRLAPGPDLAPFVELYWVVRWDLRGRPPYVQQTLPHPAVHAVLEHARSEVVGVPRARFDRRLEGVGHVLGTKFRPGGFRPLLDGPVSSLTDTTVALRDVVGDAAVALEREALDAPTDEEAAAVVERFWLARLAPTPARVRAAVEQVTAMVERIAGDPGLTRVDDLAASLGTTPRRVQRMFAEYVGVGPKWVVRRYRLHEAAERTAREPDLDWAAVAADLGYYDQAHLVRDFTATVGIPPAQYAASLASGDDHSTTEPPGR